MSKLTPYDTGERLEPHPWVPRDPGLTGHHPAESFGKVDFDDEESSTQAIVYMERAEPAGYTLHVYNTGIHRPIRVEVEDEGQPALVIQPTAALQENVRNTLAADVDPRVRDEVQVFWGDRQALILVPGEKHFRKQLLILVTDVGEGQESSAYVKGWADGVRETRL